MKTLMGLCVTSLWVSAMPMLALGETTFDEETLPPESESMNEEYVPTPETEPDPDLEEHPVREEFPVPESEMMTEESPDPYQA